VSFQGKNPAEYNLARMKLALLIIHGIGEQRPLDTLRSFVKTVWENDKSIQHEHSIPGTFYKPDRLSDSYELRRITTTKNKKDIRTDFYELYWAHLMEGNQLRHVFTWVKSLWKRPSSIPKPLKIIYWGVNSLTVIFFIQLVLVVLSQSNLSSISQFNLVPIWSLIVAPLLIATLENYVGDAARYLDASPKNIKRREEIRQIGVQILKKLNEDRAYNRIIIVGHSLGSFIAYDIIRFYWSEIERKLDGEVLKNQVISMEEMLLKKNYSNSEYRLKQTNLFKDFNENKMKWKVSDLVTLGSPLTYGSYLLASSKADFLLKVNQREFPTCPPCLDSKKLAYKDGTILHHATPFGLTKWTNLYFKPNKTIFGDVLSGPLVPEFGKGIKDIEVKSKSFGGLFKHNDYWKQSKKDKAQTHIKELRRAINLLNN